MGAVIRLKNVNIGQSPLGVVTTAFLPNPTMTFVPSVNGAITTLPTGVTLSKIGSPVFTKDYAQGQGTTDYLKTNYQRDSSKSFTLAAVVKRDATTGLQFYAGDYHNASHPKYKNNAGMAIIGSGTQGLRPVIHLLSGAIFSSANTPEPLKTGVNLSQWYFTCLTVNTETNTAEFYVPALGVIWSESLSAPMRPLEVDENIMFLGNESGAGGSSAQIALAAFYERHFTQEEVMQQYEFAKNYCASKGMSVN